MKLACTAIAFLLWIAPAQADPILTPLVATAFTEAGIASAFTITGFNAAVAVTTYTLTAGAVSNPTPLKVKP